MEKVNQDHTQLVLLIDAPGSKSILDFGDIFQLYQIFTKSTGLELPSELTLKYSKEPDSWYDYYVAKSKSINKADDDVLLDQGNREYQEARQCLNGLQEEVNHSMLVHVASKMFWILGKHRVFF